MSDESDLIAWIRQQQQTSGTVLLPAADDLAILSLATAHSGVTTAFSVGELLLVGVDQVLDGVHFRLSSDPPELIGAKAMNRNLSDCAAMAVLPFAAVVSCAIPRGLSVDVVKKIYTAMADAGKRFDCPIVGGDTGSWNGPLAISVTILGRPDGLTPVRRSGAQPGDKVYVTGPLGGSILGRHLRFTPRVHEARDIAKHFPVTAMIDLSDGLSRDLRHICFESNVGAQIVGEQIPIHSDVADMLASPQPPQFASLRRKVPLEHALHDGEDYELLFTSPADIPVETAFAIGTITPGNTIVLMTSGEAVPMPADGFEHKF